MVTVPTVLFTLFSLIGLVGVGINLYIARTKQLVWRKQPGNGRRTFFLKMLVTMTLLRTYVLALFVILGFMFLTVKFPQPPNIHVRFAIRILRDTTQVLFISTSVVLALNEHLQIFLTRRLG